MSLDTCSNSCGTVNDMVKSESLHWQYGVLERHPAPNSPAGAWPGYNKKLYQIAVQGQRGWSARGYSRCKERKRQRDGDRNKKLECKTRQEGSDNVNTMPCEGPEIAEVLVARKRNPAGIPAADDIYNDQEIKMRPEKNTISGMRLCLFLKATSGLLYCHKFCMDDDALPEVESMHICGCKRKGEEKSEGREGGEGGGGGEEEERRRRDGLVEEKQRIIKMQGRTGHNRVAK
ncbi:hypothetical protein F7725_024059 [Dissostichus mawsoni]|uniref:Uncharacterized protein n=1 Tax=Dissostichus mawsoni TaxID=36200 RepID=A0A7J5Y159_DISMA|nr:hypothetical protein F7725_024059 [Dissostichus mawsoni]